ncbi:MAG: hypothetical protein ACTSW4_03635, partial [Candidatus Ranarchaeia archaeon]
VLSNLATRIAEGKHKLTAKELGYSPIVGISLAAWIDRFFTELEQDGLVVINRSSGGGMPSATIQVTEKGLSRLKEVQTPANQKQT